MRLARRFLTLTTFLVIGAPLLPALRAEPAAFRRGDSNGDARHDLGDAVFTLHYLFLGGAPATCLDASDANDDGEIDISDALFSLFHLFLGGPEPPAPGLRCGGDATEDTLGCEAYDACEIREGQTEFSSPLQGGISPVGGPGRAEDAAGGVPPAPSPGQGPAPAPERLIEESDIYKLVGEHLYVLNRYRGLQVLDISNLDRPKVIGRAPIFGYPKEMYVRGNTAYVVVSDYYAFWRAESDIAPGGFHGSQLRIIDISNPERPEVVGGINLAGDCSDSRIVGDVMYLVSQRYPWYSGFGTTDTEDKTQILSISIGDPANVKVIDTKDFPRNGWEHHIHVTTSAMYLASSGYTGGPRWDGFETRIRYIDISDPAGSIVVRGEAVAPGGVRDRWSMDEHESVLRVASGQAWGNGDVHLTTWSVGDPDAIRQLGGYTLTVDENLTAARFDGPRAYLVTYRNIDPLFTFDLSDPARPRLLGELEMTGWLDFIVPLGGGERLVALGHEDTTNPEGQREIRLAVSLIDVSKQAAPALLSRVTLDGLWGWVPSERDDFAKVFRTLPDQGLILFPFQAWSPTDYRHVGGVQLIDFDAEKLTRRGLIRDAGWVERGIPHGESTVLTLSSELFQVIDITNRDEPRVRAKVELARNVQQFALLPGGHTVQLAGDWYRGDTELIVTPLDDPDSPEPTSRLHIPSPYGRLFVNGAMAYIASVENTTPGDPSSPRQTRVQVVDLTDPASPIPRGSVTLPEEVWPGYGAWYWGWGDEAIQVKGSTLAFHRYPYFFRWWDCLACPVGAADGVRSPGPEPVPPEHKIYLVDLADPDAPIVASTVKLEGADWAWGLKASGTTLYLSFYRAIVEGEQWMAKYFLSRIDVADPASPQVLPEVNIPGMFIDAEPGGIFIYTLESWWESSTQESRTLFHSLAIDGDVAVLQSSVDLEGYVNGIQVKDGAAVAVLHTYDVTPVAEGGFVYTFHATLITIDLADAAEIRLAGRAEVPREYVYLQKVEGGRAFLGGGAGIFTYDVSDIASPTFEAFHRTQGWVQDIVVSGDRAFLPSGYYGVQVIQLGGGGP